MPYTFVGRHYFLQNVQECLEKTMTNEEILYMLIGVYVNHKTNKNLAEELLCHRNTISKFVNMYSDLKTDVIKFEKNNAFKDKSLNQYYKSPAAAKFISKYFTVPHKNKITDELYKAIKRCCEENLNYCIIQRSTKEFAEKILRNISIKYGVSVEVIKYDILNPNNDNIFFNPADYTEEIIDDRETRKKYKRAIYECRKSHIISKNFQEVFKIFKEYSEYKKQPISYGFFYKFASCFWGNKTFEYKILDELKK